MPLHAIFMTLHNSALMCFRLNPVGLGKRHNGYQAPSVLSDMRTNCKTNNCCNCKKLVYSSWTASGAAKQWAVGSRYSC